MKELPPTERILGRVLEEQAAAHGDRVFLDFKGETDISYAQLHEYSTHFANGFLKYGIDKGAKVAVMLPNCPEYLYCWFGLAKIGAVMVPVNTAQKGELLQYIIDQSDAEVVIIDGLLLSRLNDIISGLNKVKHVFVHRGQDGVGLGEIGASALSDLGNASPEMPRVDIRHSDPMTILFTSGTTGPSKGVVMSHHYYYYAARTIGRGMENGPEDILYTCLPLFHVNAQVCTVLAALLFDARVACTSTLARARFGMKSVAHEQRSFSLLALWAISFTKPRPILTIVTITSVWRWWCRRPRTWRASRNGLGCESSMKRSA